MTLPPAGASERSADRREQYANDLGSERSLVAVTAKSNRSKSDRDPAQWLPPATSAQCTYASEWVATKLRWKLTADTKEQAALEMMADDCPDTVVEYEVAPQQHGMGGAVPRLQCPSGRPRPRCLG